MDNHSCITIENRPTDYLKGVNSPIAFKAVSDGNWTPRLEFFENQRLGWETDGCVLFTAQESFDAQVDNLIATSQVSNTMLQQLHLMGYMDLGADGLPHFHSSPRFLQVLTGNGVNGNPLHAAWDVMRKYGVLPWTDLPYDATITEAEYFAPIPQNLLDKGKQFLALIGGKDAIQYHWVGNGSTNVSQMRAALPQAPLCLGTDICEPWDQVQPPTCSLTSPVHSTMVYAIDTFTHILDHYVPYEKQLGLNYPIPYAMQGIVTMPAPINPSVVTPFPDVIQPTQANISILEKIVSLYQAIFALIKGRNLGSLSTMNYSLFRSKTFWTLVATFAFNVWQLAAPSVPPQYSALIDFVFTSVAAYFHLQTGQSTSGTN